MFGFWPDDWLMWLWERLCDGCTSAVDVARNPVTFVTFNYDRLLEYALYRMMTSAYDIGIDKALPLLAHLEPIHLHGCLGRLQYEGQSEGRPFEPLINRERIQCWKDIRIQHECKDSDEHLDRACAALEQADVICFIGFGFHKENLDKLMRRRWVASSIVASGVELPLHTRALAEHRFGDRLLIGDFDQKLMTFLPIACP